jgi:DNA-binding MarR family transcriptional regulator
MDDFETDLNGILADTFNYIQKYEESSLKNFLDVPVTINEAHMIEAIGKEKKQETTASKLAAILNITMPSATIAVKKLESKGFVQKTPCVKDARRIIISLTDTGRKIEKAHRLFHERMAKNISRQFGAEEKDVLLRAVKTLNKFFRAKVGA